VQERLEQHLMSQFSGSDGASGDDTQSLSSSDGSAHWYGHWSDSSSQSSSTNWQKQVAKMQARAAARRAREDKRFFAGVDKAFGKQAAKGMLAAFNGKGKNVLTKFKLNEKKLDEQKAKIADNTVVPTHKHAAHSKIQAKHAKKAAKKGADAKKDGDASKKADAKKADAKKAALEKTAAKLASKKIDHLAEAKKEAAVKKLADAKKKEKQEALKVAKKMADHKDPSADKEDATKAAPVAAKKGGDDDKKADAKKAYDKEEASVVKEALKVAKHMDEHKDPVYKKPVKKEDDATKAAKKAKEDKHPTVHTLLHQGILGDAKKMKHLVHEFKKASGSEKKKLKARVMQLEQEMTDDTKAVDHFGHRAQTAFARAEHKGKAGQSAKKAAVKSRADMSDAERLKADGWD